MLLKEIVEGFSNDVRPVLKMGADVPAKAVPGSLGRIGKIGNAVCGVKSLGILYNQRGAQLCKCHTYDK